MSTTLVSSGPVRTFADLLDRLGGIPSDRVLLHPSPGTATEADVLGWRPARTASPSWSTECSWRSRWENREALLAVALAERDTLDGGQVLPGFALPLQKLFEEMDEQGNG